MRSPAYDHRVLLLCWLAILVVTYAFTIARQPIVDWDEAVQAHTSSVRGWEKLPVRTG